MKKIGSNKQFELFLFLSFTLPSPCSSSPDVPEILFHHFNKKAKILIVMKM